MRFLCTLHHAACFRLRGSLLMRMEQVFNRTTFRTKKTSELISSFALMVNIRLLVSKTCYEVSSPVHCILQRERANSHRPQETKKHRN